MIMPDSTETPEMSIDALAAADMRAAMAGEEPQETPPQAEPEVVAEVPAQVPESLEAKLRARAAERQQAHQAQAQAAELAELRALKAAVEAGQYKPQDTAALERAALERLAQGDIDLLTKHGIDGRAVLKALTQRVLNPQQAQIDQLRSQLESKGGQELLTPAQVQQMIAEHTARVQTEAEFVSTITAEKFPLISKMDRAELIRRGHEIASELIQEGVRWDSNEELFSDVAQVLEERRAREYRSITGEDPPHLRPANRSTPASSNRAATPTANAVITNDLAAAGVPKTSETPEDREEGAKEILRALFVAS